MTSQKLLRRMETFRTMERLRKTISPQKKIFKSMATLQLLIKLMIKMKQKKLTTKKEATFRSRRMMKLLVVTTKKERKSRMEMAMMLR